MVRDIKVPEKDYTTDPEAISDTDALNDHIPEHSQNRIDHEEETHRNQPQPTENKEEEKDTQYITLESDSEDDISHPPKKILQKYDSKSNQKSRAEPIKLIMANSQHSPPLPENYSQNKRHRHR